MYERCRLGWVRLATVVSGDVARAEDAVADAVARVWPKYRDGRVHELEPYMRRAVVNESLGQGRRRGLADRALRRHGPPPCDMVTDEDVEHHQLLIQSLRRLSPDQRAAIALRYLVDLSEAETAATLDVTVGTVKSRVHRGLHALRGILEEVGTDG